MFYLTGRTSVVAIIRDVQNAQPTLATAWNVTNTFILALFVGAAAREAWGPRPPAPVVVAVDYGAAPKGSNKIYFEVRSMANDAIAVREKATFFMP